MRGNNKLTGGTKPTLLAPVILCLVHRIFCQRVSNQVNKFALLLHKSRFTQDSRDKPENDGGWRRWLGVFSTSALSVILRRYSLLEVPRRRIHNVIANAMSICVAVGKSVKYPSPEAYASTSPSGGEVGRSMIEMLGVLAIIAVLSVGGITGYSKAMQMWKSNIQKNALTELMMTMIKIKPNLDRNMAGIVISDAVAAMGDMPENLTLAANAFWDKNNNELYIYWGHKEDEGNRLTYRLYGIMLSQQKSKFITQETKEYCRNLLSAAKAVAAEINYIYYWRPGSQNSYAKHFVTGQDLISATPVDIHKHCDIILDDDALAIANFTIDFKTD